MSGDLPAGSDGGTAGALVGIRLPEVALPATDGTTVELGAPGTGRTVFYFYPMTGRPGVDLPPGWDDIPGARGCTAEACGFRDHHDELRQAGARLYGVSSQDSEYQAEAVERLRLPFAMLSDSALAIGDALGLPTFSVSGMTLYRRLTIIATDGVVEHAFYPVPSPDRHAVEVIRWLSGHLPSRRTSSE